MCLVPDTRLRAVRRLNGYYPDQPRGQVTDVAIENSAMIPAWLVVIE